jgi:hypothetical protein
MSLIHSLKKVPDKAFKGILNKIMLENVVTIWSSDSSAMVTVNISVFSITKLTDSESD